MRSFTAHGWETKEIPIKGTGFSPYIYGPKIIRGFSP